jgi:hypothetical protein
VRGDKKVYYFEGEAAVGKLFNGLFNMKRSGVPNGETQTGLLPTRRKWGRSNQLDDSACQIRRDFSYCNKIPHVIL